MHRSIYLSSPLEEKLDAYIAAHSLRRSQVIQKALAFFFKEEAPSSADETLKKLLRKDRRKSATDDLTTSAKAHIRHALKDDTW